MHVPRAFANCLQYGNKVYVFGGRSSPNKRSKKIEVFDCETHQWTILDVYFGLLSINFIEESKMP